MFYSYADKQGDGFFGSWQLRQVAFDTMRRYLYYSEPTKDAFPIPQSTTSTSPPAASAGNASGASSQPSSTTERGGVTPETEATAAASSSWPSKVTWKKKMKVTAVVPVATRANFVHRTASERDLYQLEVKGESRPLATGEYPPAGPLLCPSAGLSTLDRDRCTVHNEAYIRDPFFLKELFDALRDQFDEMTKAKVRAAAAAAEGGASSDEAGAEAMDLSVQTLVSPRKPKTDTGGYATAAVVPVRVVLRCRDEREFRRLWYVVQTVLGYDKLIVRPYRGLPPYDPRNGVAFAHIPMTVWHTFKALDRAVFYTFLRGNFYSLERAGTAAGTAVPRLRLVLEGAYLCITHDSVLCMRESGNIPRWLRLAEVQEFHWDAASRNATTHTTAPFCVFLSDAPIPDLFFEPTAPAYGADTIAAYDPLVDVRRIAQVIHDTCFASFSTRRVIRIREVADASMAAYVARTVREGTRLPALQTGGDFNSTLSCPLPKEQLAVVWQQVQSELLERGNMANRAAIPIYRTTARDVALSEDQLSTVERELDEGRERRDDVVGMPLERARQLERRRRAAVDGANGRRSRQRHRDVGGAALQASVNTSSPTTTVPATTTTTTTTTTQVVPLTMELLQTPQLQGRFATTVEQLHHATGSRSGVGSKSERSNDSSAAASTVTASEYSSYLVPGARYLTQEEWQSGGYASAATPLSPAPDAAGPRSPAPIAATAAGAAATSATVTQLPLPIPTGPSTGGEATVRTPVASSSHRSSGTSGSGVAGSRKGSVDPAAATQRGGTGGRHDYAEERTVNEIVGRSMAALDGSRVDLSQLEKKK